MKGEGWMDSNERESKKNSLGNIPFSIYSLPIRKLSANANHDCPNVNSKMYKGDLVFCCVAGHNVSNSTIASSVGPFPCSVFNFRNCFSSDLLD
jgi:hypothetical protein